MRVKILLGLLAVVIALGLSVYVRATPGHNVRVHTVIFSPQVAGKEDTLRLCFTTKGGVDVRTLDLDQCPKRKAFEKEEAGLLARLGARRDLLEGYTVVFTRHIVMVPSDGVFIWADGVMHYGKLDDGHTVKLIVVTTHKTRSCAMAETLRHELGHAAFTAVGMTSEWLDTQDDTHCDYTDDNELAQIVMTPGKNLPPGPIRARFEKR